VGALGAMMGVVGLIDTPVHALVVAAAAYGMGWSGYCAMTPGRGRLGILPPAPHLPDLADLRTLAQALNGTVDEATTTHMKRIIQKLDEIYPRLEATEGAASDTIRRAVLDYIPTTIRTYLALPGSVRSSRRLANGRTPREQIARDLERLEQELASQQDELIRGDIAAMEAHGAFLEQRFNKDDPFAAA
jgi:hypothetical protein